MNVLPCGFKQCDVYDLTPWKSQCSFEGTDDCGAETIFMDKSKVFKMDKATFNEIKRLEMEVERWRSIANGLLHGWCSNYGISRERAIEKYFPEFKEPE